MTLGEKIKDLRKLNKLTQDALAEACGVSRRSVIDWEHDKYHPQTDILILLAKALNTELSYFAEEDKKKTNDIRGSIIMSTKMYRMHDREAKYKRAVSPLLIGFLIFLIAYLIFSIILNNAEVYFALVILVICYLVVICRKLRDIRLENRKRIYLSYDDGTGLVLSPYVNIKAYVSDRLSIKYKDADLINYPLDKIDHIELYKNNMMVYGLYPKSFDEHSVSYSIIICFNDGETSKIYFPIKTGLFKSYEAVYSRKIIEEAFNALKIRTKK